MEMEKLLEEYEYLVKIALNKYLSTSRAFGLRDELYVTGMTMLWIALKKADLSDPGHKKYIYTRILGAFKDAGRDEDCLSRHYRRHKTAYQSVVNRLSVELGRQPTKEEITVLFKASDSIRSLEELDVEPHHVSVKEAILMPSNESSILDRLILAEDIEKVRSILDNMPPKWKETIVAMYFDNEKGVEIAKRLGKTQGEINRRKKIGLSYLKKEMSKMT